MSMVESRKQFSGDIPEEPVMNMSTLGTGLELKFKKTVELTHEEAYRMLELPEFAGDRPLSNNHVVFLQRQMTSGMFRWEQVQIITCIYQKREYRMNGQHTCWARLNMPASGIRSPVTTMRYEAQSEHDMRQLYASIDRNKGRSSGQVVLSYLAGRAEFSQFNKSILRALAEALAFWHWEKETQRQLHAPDDRAYLMLTDFYQLTTKVGNFLNQVGKKKENMHVFRRPVLAAMYATFNAAPDISIQFWKAIMTGEMLSKDDPQMLLRNKLMTSSIAAGGAALSSKITTTSSEEMFRWCILAWNAFRKNSHVKSFAVKLEEDRTAVRS